MLRYKTETRPGLVALYDIQPGNRTGPFLQPRSPHGAHGHSNAPVEYAMKYQVCALSSAILTGWYFHFSYTNYLFAIFTQGVTLPSVQSCTRTSSSWLGCEETEVDPRVPTTWSQSTCHGLHRSCHTKWPRDRSWSPVPHIKTNAWTRTVAMWRNLSVSASICYRDK